MLREDSTFRRATARTAFTKIAKLIDSVGESRFLGLERQNIAVPLGPAPTANSLCRGQEKRTIRQTSVQIENSGFDQGRPFMRKILLCATLIAFWPALGLAQTTEELANDGKNTENVTTQSMGYDRKSYSPLKQINKSNVKRLVPIWSTSLMNDQGELAAPTIYNGVMYVINGKWTFAIDVETGKQIWRTPVHLEPETRRTAFHRGAATIYNGKLFRVTIDDHVLALDMKTGEEVWNQKFADLRDGYYATGGPIIANGVLISGVSGGESTTRGFLDGWDPDTGKKLWRRYTIPAPGEPGSETWPKNSDAWTQGGGPTWRSGSYDPQLDLVYWGRAMRSHTIPDPAGIWIACTRPAYSRSGRRRVRSLATINTRLTICMTWTARMRMSSRIYR